MKRNRIIIWTIIAACILCTGLVYLLTSSGKPDGFLWKAPHYYMKYCVNIPHGDDAHRFYVNDGYTSPNAYIAHGGGIQKYVFNNSIEAAQDSIQRGFRFIEFDLLVTSDGHLVGGHNWPQLREMAHLPVTDEPLSMAEVEALSRPGEFSPVTAKDICRLLELNPDLTIVTDQITDYELLLREIPYPDRLIVEILGTRRWDVCMRYREAVKAGVRYPAMTVRNKPMIELAYDCNIPIIVFGDLYYFENQESADVVKRLHDKGITILIFSQVNPPYWDTAEFVREHLGKSFSLIYTEHWGPKDLLPSDNTRTEHE